MPFTVCSPTEEKINNTLFNSKRCYLQLIYMDSVIFVQNSGNNINIEVYITETTQYHDDK